MKFTRSAIAWLVLTASFVWAEVPTSPLDIPQPHQSGSADHGAGEFHLAQAPIPQSLLLKNGDRLAIIGDSITEQKMYSRIIETYLTACTPELEITARQFGWSGETAEGFLRRMESDCLRFAPTIATLCYGMNDHRYRTYTTENAEWYARNYRDVVRGLKSVGARVVLGSPGCVGKVPTWTNSDTYSLAQLNANLATLRNVDIQIAQEEGIGFADVFWPMLKADKLAREKYGNDYAVPGKDGVHPDWSGQLVMAYSFLKAMGLPSRLANIRVNLRKNTASASPGHEILSQDNGLITIRSQKYPFCLTGPLDKDNSMRSGATLVPFFEDLNQFRLVVRGGTAATYTVTWGEKSRLYTNDQLLQGINLAEDFEINPFSEPFKAIDEAVAAKQNYETRQIKQMFHSQEFQADPDAVVALTEKVRTPLAEKIASRIQPVEHQIRIQPAN